jgi:iron(III) transport system substrate-binding protein
MKSKTSMLRLRRVARRSVLAGVAMATAALWMGPAQAQSASRSVPDAEWNKILEAARKEGKVVVYATMAPPQHDRLVAAFNAAYPGIKMELLRIVGTAMTIKFEQEREAQNVAGGDVMITADVRWAMEGGKKGYLKNIVGPNAAKFPDVGVHDNKIAFVVGMPWIMSYNTELVKEPIKNYQDLLRPDLKGKIGSTSLVAEVVNIWWSWVDRNNPGLLDRLGKEQSIKMYASSTAAAAAAGSGEIAVNSFSVIPLETALIAQKAPLKIVIPNPAYGFAYGGAAVSWSKNPNAALVALDFILSEKGQAALVGNSEASSVIPNFPNSIDLKANNISLLNWEEYPPERIKAFEQRWNSLFGAR